VPDQTAQHPERVQQLFDSKAATWSAKYVSGGPLAGRLAWLADVVTAMVPPGGQVLDLGCGTGDLACYLASAGFTVTGCDISASMLARAAATDEPVRPMWVRLAPGWTALPFSEGAFDAVVASSVLEYVNSPTGVLTECARLLRPGGISLITAPDLAHPVRWLEGIARPGAALLARARITRVNRLRLANYVRYLHLSQHRHLARWWRRAAAQAGMVTLPRPTGPDGRIALRLYVFQRPVNAGEDR